MEPKLNVRNTITKALLDQSIGAVVNTLLFSLFVGSIQAAMSHRPAAHQSLAFLASGKAIDYGRVDWADLVSKTKVDFWSMIVAGWRFWPFVSLINFTFVKTVEMRNLVGGLAGLAWGVYVSMFAVQ